MGDDGAGGDWGEVIGDQGLVHQGSGSPVGREVGGAALKINPQPKGDWSMTSVSSLDGRKITEHFRDAITAECGLVGKPDKTKPRSPRSEMSAATRAINGYCPVPTINTACHG